jgi:hypothetical protein
LRADIFLCDTAGVHAVGAPALSSVFAALLLTRPMLDVEAFDGRTATRANGSIVQ